jgi:hypothetical protein
VPLPIADDNGVIDLIRGRKLMSSPQTLRITVQIAPAYRLWCETTR